MDSKHGDIYLEDMMLGARGEQFFSFYLALSQIFANTFILSLQYHYRFHMYKNICGYRHLKRK